MKRKILDSAIQMVRNRRKNKIPFYIDSDGVLVIVNVTKQVKNRSVK